MGTETDSSNSARKIIACAAASLIQQGGFGQTLDDYEKEKEDTTEVVLTSPNKNQDIPNFALGFVSNSELLD
jgi:hypothetical protein